jgi:branched-chain amino acid transport system ATP-binding protein
MAPAVANDGAAAGELRAQRVNVAFGDFQVLKDVDLIVRQGETVGLIGPNGAGKTTLVNVLSGYQSSESQTITLDSVDIQRWSPGRRVRAGLSRTFQAGRLFGRLTCRENVVAAGLATGLRPHRAEEVAEQLLDRVQLSAWGDAPAGRLPYGHARLLTVARALATRPRFLLLDEPAAGMNEAEAARFVELLKGLPSDYGCGLVVIEHDMSVIMAVCEWLLVLDHGVAIGYGTPEEIRANLAVRKAYFGSEGQLGADGE